MHNRLKPRKWIRIRDWARLLGTVAAAAAIIVGICLLAAARNRRVEALNAETVKTPSPVYTPAQTPAGLPDLDIASWQLALVNDGHHLDEDYAPPRVDGTSRTARKSIRVSPCS